MYFGEDDRKVVVLLIGGTKKSQSTDINVPRDTGLNTWRRDMPKKKPTPYEEGLHERLKEPSYAAEYLNAHLEDYDGHTVEVFLLALRHVAAAHGFATISKKSDLGRESLYKTLSKSGNPKIETLSKLLNTMGLKLSVEPKLSKKKRTA